MLGSAGLIKFCGTQRITVSRTLVDLHKDNHQLIHISRLFSNRDMHF